MKRIRSIVLIALFTILLATACKTEKLSQTQLQLERYSLKKPDLPSGWKFSGKSWDVDYGGESYTVVYKLDEHIFISHTVSIHSTEEQAQKAYKEWETSWFNSVNLQPEIQFSPLDQDDDFRYQCEQMEPNYPLTICYYLQGHNNVINFVKINFDIRNKNNPTFTNVNDILGVLDERLNKVVIGEESNTTQP